MIKRRYQFVFALLRPFFRLLTAIMYRYHSIPAPDLPKGQPALILSNHNGAMDPFFLAVSFKRPIFFVASDHIFRLSLVSKLIRALVAPIPIVKSQMDLRTLRQIRERIQEGALIGLFPEGNRSFSGRTMYIPPSTGKLVKQLKCSLILYRIDGGYLTTPRWAVSRRKGFMQGSVVRCIEPDELAGMSAEKIYQIITETLQVDAFSVQRKKMVAYRGKKLAETLELTLFVCPRCKGLATLSSRNDQFSCSCGLTVRYTEYGFFEPLDEWSVDQQLSGRFMDNVSDWDQWQRSVLADLLFSSNILDTSGQTPLFKDQAQQLVLTERAEQSHVIASGCLELYADRLVFYAGTKPEQTKSFPLTEISRMIVHGPQTLQFTTTMAQVWEVRSNLRRSAYKYVLTTQLLRQHLKGETYELHGI